MSTDSKEIDRSSRRLYGGRNSSRPLSPRVSPSRVAHRETTEKGFGMSTNPAKTWMRIPNGTKVRLLEGGQQGVVDGLTELVMGTGRNPDGRTQYRINVGEPVRLLMAQAGLVVLTDTDGVVLIGKENISYRRAVTDQLRAELPADRFAVQA